jgi:Metallo-peptidase family M12
MMYARLILATSLLGCCFLTGTDSVSAQPQEKGVRLIMSMPRSSLPIRHALGRRNYDAIKKLARRIGSQILPLTGTEMWSIPQENVEAVRKAAARYGVVVNQLGENWNHVFRSTPTNIGTNDSQKAMMAGARFSQATVGVGIAQHAAAEILEYALTKDAGAQAISNEAPKIKLQLDDNTALTITRTSVDIRSNMCSWHGMVDGTNAPATIMWWPGLAMAGRVQHEGRIYSIRHVPGQIHAAVAVVEISEDRMPPEHASTPSRLRTNDRNLRDDPLIQQGDASVLRSLIPGMRPAAQSQDEDKRQKTAAVIARTKGSARKMPKADGAKDVTINVIVAYTKKVASSYADVRRELVELAVEETNQSFRNSNLGYVKLKLVHSYQTDYVEEGEHFNHLWRFADKGDGYMDEIHGLREKYDADVAVLIVDDPKGCGLSTRVFADADEAFAVVHHECAALSYSLAHEIGHLIGARHDLAMDKTMTPFPYAHGYVNGTKWRDIMSYKASCGGCPRLPIWSSPNVLIRGEPAGTTDDDNARVIAEQAARVANFRPSRNNGTHGAKAIPRASSTGTTDRALPK